MKHCEPELYKMNMMLERGLPAEVTHKSLSQWEEVPPILVEDLLKPLKTYDSLQAGITM